MVDCLAALATIDSFNHIPELSGTQRYILHTRQMLLAQLKRY